MELEGTVRNGVVVFPAELPWPEGTRVTVTPKRFADDPSEGTVPTILERYREIIGIAPELPADMAENHDHYVHGAPKK